MECSRMEANGTRSSSCPTPEGSPSEDHEDHSCSSDGLDHLSPRNGTVIPNRIFVGGFDRKVCESDLWSLFSQYGAVSDVKIIQNRSRPTKWYGFVTFETPGDAQRLLLNANRIYLKENRLIVRTAFRRLHGSRNFPQPMFSVEPVPVPCGAMFLTTSSGFPYTFHNGVAYFHSPHLWTAQPAPAVLPQPYQHLYHQPPVYPQQCQPRCFPNQYQWNNESPVSSAPVMYPQPEFLYHVPEGFSAQGSSEHYDSILHQSYSMFPLRAERGPRFGPQQYTKGLMFPSFPAPPSVSYLDQSETEAQSVLQ